MNIMMWNCSFHRNNVPSENFANSQNIEVYWLSTTDCCSLFLEIAHSGNSFNLSPQCKYVVVVAFVFVPAPSEFVGISLGISLGIFVFVFFCCSLDKFYLPKWMAIKLGEFSKRKFSKGLAAIEFTLSWQAKLLLIENVCDVGNMISHLNEVDEFSVNLQVDVLRL